MFKRDGKGNTRSEDILISSSEGCRVESLVTEDSGVRGGPAFKFDNNAGLVAWLDSAREVWFLRFTVDVSGNININSDTPQFALAPTSTAEFLGSLDVWADYSDPSQPIEYISLSSYIDQRVLEPPGSGTDSEIRIIDLSACSENGCMDTTLISKNSVDSLACTEPGPFDPIVQPECLYPNTSTPTFNDAGDKIYYTTRTNRSASVRWYGTARLIQSSEGWLTEPESELVAISTKWDCVDGGIPSGGNAATIDGKEIIVATACVGFYKGLRDQRLYFLDADVCVNDPVGWMDCISRDLVSGVIRSANPSWQLNGEVLHDSWGPGSIRAIRPEDLSDDRELIRKGGSADSGR